jgi:Zn-dependent metalloprotease
MRFRLQLVMLIAVVSFATPAFGFVQADVQDYEVHLPLSQVAPDFERPTADKAGDLSPELAAFTTGEGRGWRILLWDRDLGAPASLAGPAIPLVSADASEPIMREAAEAFVVRHAALLKVNPRDLRVLSVSDMGKERTLILFGQYVDGFSVINGRLDLVLWRGQVVLISSRVYQGVAVDRFPSLDPSTAIQAAHLGIPESAADAAKDEPRLVILPILRDGTLEYHLAWEIHLKTEAPDGLWRTYVDARDGSILWRESEYDYYQITGNSQATIELNTYGDPFTNGPLRDEKVTATGGGTFTGYSDQNGDYVVEVPFQAPYTVTAKISGRWCIAVNSAGSNAQIIGSGSPGTPLNFLFDDTNSTPAERDAYYHVNVAHSWIKSVEPTFTGMDTPITTNVNIGGSGALICNAYWSQGSGTLNFYKEGGGCNNFGRISDIIYHEYGHGITQRIYQPLSPPTASGMGEGFSDTDAMTINNNPVVGENAFTSGAPIRTGDYTNLRQYPGTECSGEVHCLGEILTGAMWKTRDNYNMKYGAGAAAEYDPTWIAARKGKADNMPAFLTKMLMADDDDGNLTNGTPNWLEICEAFETHNLPCPALTNYVDLASSPIPDQGNPTGGYPITATAVAVGGGAIDPNGVLIYYTLDPPQTNPTWNTAAMAATANPDEYAGEIPNQGCGKMVYYYVRAQKLTGESATAPIQAPYRNYYRFIAGTYMTVMTDDLETDQGWTIGAPGDDATEGLWQRADPVGKHNTTYGWTQPEDDHTPSGTNCFVTDARGGLWAQYDVDNGRTTVLSPIFDWSPYAGYATVSYWAFVFADMPPDDSLRCSISNDGGVNWLDIGKIRYRANNWTQYKNLVTSDQLSFTNQMRIRFQMADLGTQSTCVEAAIDDIDIRVNTCVSAAIGEEIATLPFDVEQNRPNPFHGGTTIRFSLSAPAQVDVEVFDAGGRKVRTLLNEARGAGGHVIAWDGRDDGGHAVGSGLYWYTVKAGEQKAGHKMILVR